MSIEDHSKAQDAVIAAVESSHQAALKLAASKGSERSYAIKQMAEAVAEAFDEILEANTLDLEISREMAVSEVIIDWLKLTPERLHTAIDILERLEKISDPLQRLMNATHQLDPSQTYCQLMPLGVIAFIYEALPELAAIVTGLSIKTGNSLLLRGGSEASHTNAVIGRALQNAIEEAGLPRGTLEVLPPERGFSIADLVTQERHLNLIIPYGRSSLVEQVKHLATAPVLETAMGNCYLYWSTRGELDSVLKVILDSHSSQPDPVNAIEKVLIQSTQEASCLLRMFQSLEAKGFELRGEPQLQEQFPEQLRRAEYSEWKSAYLRKTIAFKTVKNLESAVSWINTYSSGHADCLVSNSYRESQQFASGINSALVYINTSPRFYRHPQGGNSVFLGMSNQRGRRRGLIGLEALTTIKQVVQGDGCW